MRLFVCTDHDAHYGVPVASVVLAKSEHHARLLLDQKLVEHGLKPCREHPYALRPISKEVPAAYVLSDGNY